MSGRATSPSSLAKLRLITAILPVLVAGCGGDAGAGPGAPADGVVRFVVADDLDAPVTVSIDGITSLILSSGQSSGLAVSPAAQWLTWTSAKPTDAAGTPIPDDIGQVKFPVSGIRSVLEITNVINDTTFITAQIRNNTSARVEIGVYEGTTVSCASVLDPAYGGVPGFTKIGYYRLLPATEVRAYHDGSQCTGTYRVWGASQLAAFTPKSGIVNLTLTSAP